MAEQFLGRAPKFQTLRSPLIAAAAPDPGTSWQWPRLGGGWCLAAAARAACPARLAKGQEAALGLVPGRAPALPVRPLPALRSSSSSCVFPTDPGKLVAGS